MMIANIAAGTIAIRFGAQGPMPAGGDGLRHLHQRRGRGLPRRRARLCRRHPRRRQRGDDLPAGHRRVYQLRWRSATSERPRPRLHPLRQRRAAALSWARAPACCFWRNTSTRMARGAKIYAEIVRLRQHLRRLSHHRPAPRGGGRAPAPFALAMEQAGITPDGHGIHQRARHRHAA